MDRERLLDMEEKIKPVRAMTMGILGLALLAAGPWLGWWTLAPLVIAMGLFAAADRGLADKDRPEYRMFAAWAGAEVTIAIAVAFTHDTHLSTLSWLAIPVVTLSSRFSMRGVFLGVALALALTVAVAFIGASSAVIDDPPLLIAPLALVLCVATLSTALMRSDVQHRSESVIDPLTGMLNRKALQNRSLELSQQSRITGEPVGLIVGDLDHFKEVNDTLGHATGDGVLKDIAYLMRKRLRAFDLAYRIGGEEFLVLLPGADAAQAATLAEELRAAVADQSFEAGIQMTMSFGVSASKPGETFDYQASFAAADGALYEAKRLGRNRVCEARPGEPASALESEPSPSLAG
jgi:diguanylate cyclase (GGDEF)-like protein